jgi:hypothetical protein
MDPRVRTGEHGLVSEYRVSATDGFQAVAELADDDAARVWARGHVTAERPRVMLDRRVSNDPGSYPWESLGVVRRLTST